MKERPILFSAPMVRALLDGRKTQTRRIVKHPDPIDCVEPSPRYDGEWVPFVEGTPHESIASPYGVPGDVLWVKETYRLDVAYDNEKASALDGRQAVWYEADQSAVGNGVAGKLRPSIFMRRAFSRIILRITDVRVERLNECSPADAEAEGVQRANEVGYIKWFVPGVGREVGYHDQPVDAYRALWDHINGPGAWVANPWVWAVSFERAT